MAARSNCIRRSEQGGVVVYRFRSWSFACAVLAIASTHGFAQQLTTATYEDWTVRCTLAAKPPTKVCDMEQFSRIKGSNKPFSRLVISRPEKGQPLRLIIQVPVNVWLATGVKIQMDGKDSGLTGPFTRCLPVGCFAAIALKDDIARVFRAAKAQVRIVYANAANSEVTIPLSPKGFSQAFNALAKE
jgi:invasion protein IalB